MPTGQQLCMALPGTGAHARGKPVGNQTRGEGIDRPVEEVDGGCRWWLGPGRVTTADAMRLRRVR